MGIDSAEEMPARRIKDRVKNNILGLSTKRVINFIINL